MRNPKIAILLLLLVCVSFTIIEWLLIELPSSVMYSQKFVLWYCKYLWNYNTDRQEISRQYLHNKNVSRCSIVTSQQIQDGGRPPFWRSLNHHISVKNHPILIKFGTLQHILNPMTVTWPKIEIFKIQDGGRRHLENRFFGHNSSTDFLISAKFCTRKQNGMPTKAMWQNCKFLKSTMADGRHFENR